MQIWDTVNKERWYHLPVKTAPRHIKSCKYIAFYFPKLFGLKKRYHVINYSEILSIETYKRIELFPADTKHKNADKDYYKLNLGQLQTLPKPIPSKSWRRIVFIPTTLEKLFNSEEINDLYDTSILENIMYGKLKELMIEAERQLYVYTENKCYCLDFGIFCREGNIDVECDGETYHRFIDAYTKDRLRNNELTSHGWSVLRFGTNDIRYSIDDCVQIIAKTIDNLGGVMGYKCPED